MPCEAPPRGVVPSLCGGLPPPPATVAGIATMRQGPIGSRQAAPRAPCLTLVGSGFPMRHRLVGLPLSPRWACPFAPGQAPPGREFVHGPRKGGCPARPPRGGPSPAARRRHPTFTWSPVSRDSPGTLPGLPARGSNRPIARQPPRPLSFRELTAGHAGRPDDHQAPPPPLQLAPVCTSVPSVVPFCGSLPGRPAHLGSRSCLRFSCFACCSRIDRGPGRPTLSTLYSDTVRLSCHDHGVRPDVVAWVCEGMPCVRSAS